LRHRNADEIPKIIIHAPCINKVFSIAGPVSRPK
jgi:hypothetical protein